MFDNNCVLILPSWFSKLFYNYQSTFLLSERWEPSQKTAGMFGAFEFVGIMGAFLFVGIMGASVSDRWK